MGPPAASLAAFRQAHPPARLLVDGACWEYIRTGRGEQALLFLHGMAGAHDIWWQQIEALQDRFRIVSLTYPAVGTLEGLRHGINAVLQAAGVDRFSVVGSSLGGYLAQYLIARQPERIRRAVFANTFPPNTVLASRTRGADLLIRLVPQALLMAGMRWNTRLSIYPASGPRRCSRPISMKAPTAAWISPASWPATGQCWSGSIRRTLPVSHC